MSVPSVRAICPLAHCRARRRDDALREPLDDRGLPDARFADEHGIVLGAARENLDGAADFGIAANDRVELALARGGGEVAPIFLERFVSGLRILAGDTLVAADLLHRGEKGAAGKGQAAEDARDLGFLVFAEHGEDEMLDRDVLVLEFLGLVLGADEELVEPMRNADLSAGAGAADFSAGARARPGSS